MIWLSTLLLSSRNPRSGYPGSGRGRRTPPRLTIIAFGSAGMTELRRWALALLLLLAAVAPAFAIDPDEILPNPKQEAAARALFGEFRCLVCQSQSIETSEAPLAKDLRNLVRQEVVAGKSPVEIRRFLVERYGDFILMKPPLDATTVLLWATPGLIVLLGGGLAGWALLRRRKEAAAPAPLGPNERARLAALLDE